MNLKKMALATALACASYSGNALAVDQVSMELVSCRVQTPCAVSTDDDSACADTTSTATSGDPIAATQPYDCGTPACGNANHGCDSGCSGGGCDSGCASGRCLTKCGLGDCCLGDPWKLFGEHDGWSAGGWVQTGYHNKAIPIFNNRPDELNLHQAWLWAEKSLDTTDGFSIGGRIDYLYGIDAQNTQAFGKDDGHWDNDWDNGQFGNAMPQLYGEIGYGDWSVKLGHFYTVIGYEVVQATGNFFYSHAYTFNNSEPFTHTGALATYNASEDVTMWAGYTLGWDSGFKDNGDAFLGGLSMKMTDRTTLTYATSIGTFGDDINGGNTGARENGYMHSIVADVALSDSLQYVFQSDILDTDANSTGRDIQYRQTYGINQYLIKTINDCWKVGARFEWYNVDNFDSDASTLAGRPVYSDGDVYALTLGINHQPNANVTIRPEIRWDWDDNGVVGLAGGDDDQTTFGVDTIFTF